MLVFIIPAAKTRHFPPLIWGPEFESLSENWFVLLVKVNIWSGFVCLLACLEYTFDKVTGVCKLFYLFHGPCYHICLSPCMVNRAAGIADFNKLVSVVDPQKEGLKGWVLFCSLFPSPHFKCCLIRILSRPYVIIICLIFTKAQKEGCTVSQYFLFSSL